MYTGSLRPVSTEAMLAVDKISKILLKVPDEEWTFVTKQALEKAWEVYGKEV